MTSADEKQKEKKAPTTLDMERLYVQNSEFCWFSVRNYIYSVTSSKDRQKKLPYLFENIRKYPYFCSQVMQKVTNPFVWLARFRHRRGYGVHSPFAFRFITDVIYERCPYYAYRELDRALPLSMQMRKRRGLHLLLRLANHLQPQTIVLPTEAWWEKRYMQSGCRRTSFYCQWPDDEVGMCLLREPSEEALKHMGEHSVLLLDNLQRHRQWFQSLPSVVSFDLYDLGIAFFDKQYNKQYYIVNF